MSPAERARLSERAAIAEMHLAMMPRTSQDFRDRSAERLRRVMFETWLDGVKPNQYGGYAFTPEGLAQIKAAFAVLERAVLTAPTEYSAERQASGVAIIRAQVARSRRIVPAGAGRCGALHRLRSRMPGTRPKVRPRDVEALAAECRRLRLWLRGPGASAGPEAFGVAARAYRALVAALQMLPHGTRYLREFKAVPTAPAPYPYASTERDADSFTADELVALEEPLLTPQGVVVRAPLIPHVDIEREALGAGATDKQALRAILARLALRQGKRVTPAELAKWQTRLSRDRTAYQAAVTGDPEKMPPGDP